MPSYVSMLVHCVWSTKERKPLIAEEWSDDLYGYLGGILRNNRATLLAAGGMPDHVHLLMSLPSTLPVAKTVNLLKSNSTTWVKEQIASARQFRWQERYGAFSVSKSHEERIRTYIANQKRHHARRPFQAEFLALLEKHGVEYDERYIWD
ncbi:MAG: IS200/IS605 family transposase [Planctomycetales bacterium]